MQKLEERFQNVKLTFPIRSDLHHVETALNVRDIVIFSRGKQAVCTLTSRLIESSIILQLDLLSGQEKEPAEGDSL